MTGQIPVLNNADVYNIVYTANDDGTRIIEHERREFAGQDTVVKGAVGILDGKRYWLFRDAMEALWILGDGIDPIEVTDDVTATLDRGSPRCLEIKRGDNVILHVPYAVETDPIPARFDFTAAGGDEERGDFGKFIHRVLNTPTSRHKAWGKDWPQK